MKNSKILQWAVAVAIIIVLNLFFYFATKLVYKPPLYNDYCKQDQSQQVSIPQDSKTCLAGGGQWTDYGRPVPADYPVPMPVKTVPKMETGNEPTGYCNINYTCQKQFDEVQKVYNRNVFVVLVVLGLLSLGAGFYLTQSGAVSLGLSFGGVVSLIIGSVRYWSDMDDYLRLIILGLALAVLIWLGIKKLRDN